MLRFLRKLRNCGSGATAVEYGLIAGLISVVIIVSITITGNELINVFIRISDALQSVPPAP
jgi:pilus assembly protein Flp/PilA